MLRAVAIAAVLVAAAAGAARDFLAEGQRRGAAKMTRAGVGAHGP